VGALILQNDPNWRLVRCDGFLGAEGGGKQIDNIGKLPVKTFYRSDIDGLRGIAVLAVVCFHGFPTRIGGGFVGVDIFFVISGFLISSIIIESRERNAFSFLEFYARRVRRIFPALAVVLIACMSFGWLVLFPDEYQQLGKHIAAGAGFVGNLISLHEAGYFDTNASFKPLLHLWSLGVEEQFYFVWPVLVLLSWRWRQGPIVIASAVLIISFFFNLILTRTNQSAAFYLPVTRFWELMLGCIVAIAQTWRTSVFIRTTFFERLERSYLRHRNAVNDAVASIGIAMIFAAVILINENRYFPGAWALLPTVGTVFLIAAGKMTFISHRLLGNRILVHVGLISYPLYLWHWPILSFARILHYEEPSRLVRTTCIAAAFVLAELTYRFVEKPIRFGALTAFKPIVTCVALTMIGGLGLVIFEYGGIPARFPADVQIWVRDFRGEARATNGEGRCFIDPGKGVAAFTNKCDGGEQANTRKIVLWGDSHAAQLVPGLREIMKIESKFTLAQYTASGCPPILNFVTARIPNCRSINEFVIRKIEQLKPDTVIMVGRWDLYDGSGGVGRVDFDVIRETVDRLKSLGVKRVVAVGQFPIWKVAPPKILARSFRTAAFSTVSADAIISERNKSFLHPSTFVRSDEISQALKAAGAIVVTPLSTFCNDDGCLLVVPGSHGEPIVWDDAGHMTEAGSKYFVAVNAGTIFNAEEPRPDSLPLDANRAIPSGRTPP
jgi:peptidoglycan/LPS O-acetylase OafA/YrhL